MQATRCYIGIGSNLNQPIKQVCAAINAFKNLPQIFFKQSSSLYQSRPMMGSPSGQADYINAVVALNVALTPLQLLAQLQTLERDFGRSPQHAHWGARELDLDILLFGELEMSTEQLTIPHPGLARREFVVYPLFELAPNLLLPAGEDLKTVKDRFAGGGLRRLTVAIETAIP